MMISVNNPVTDTYIFLAILLIAILFSARRKTGSSFFSLEATKELKGFAILAVIFSHIGYFLAVDHRFLFPLSILAGVGVNIFLFLSGYGLTISALSKKQTTIQFFQKRLLKLFIPMWCVLIVYYLLDFFVLKKAYSVQYIFHSFVGFFSQADLYNDINSPLWYFTLIVLYYLIFPFVFWRRWPWLSALVIYVGSYYYLKQNPSWLHEIFRMYAVHVIAFPLGVFAGWLFFRSPGIDVFLPQRILRIISNHKLLVKLRDSLANSSVISRFRRHVNFVVYYGVIIISALLIAHFAYHSGVGESINKEQFISIVTALLITFLFLFKKIEFRFFSLVGIYSYEIYLFHWPMLYRYDFLYRFIPSYLATGVYIAIFIGLGWCLQKFSVYILTVTGQFLSKFKRK